MLLMLKIASSLNLGIDVERRWKLVTAGAHHLHQMLFKLRVKEHSICWASLNLLGWPWMIIVLFILESPGRRRKYLKTAAQQDVINTTMVTIYESPIALTLATSIQCILLDYQSFQSTITQL
jgi:hypothetical protein